MKSIMKTITNLCIKLHHELLMLYIYILFFKLVQGCRSISIWFTHDFDFLAIDNLIFEKSSRKSRNVLYSRFFF